MKKRLMVVIAVVISLIILLPVFSVYIHFCPPSGGVDCLEPVVVACASGSTNTYPTWECRVSDDTAIRTMCSAAAELETGQYYAQYVLQAHEWVAGISYSNPWTNVFNLPDTYVNDMDNDGYSWCEDCDDSDPSVYPDADEICDGKLNDCEWDEVDGGCDCTGTIDSGCDSDGDRFCDARDEVDLDWLVYCSDPKLSNPDLSDEEAGEIKFSKGCCVNTLEWYKTATDETVVAEIYDKLTSVATGLEIYSDSAYDYPGTADSPDPGTAPKYRQYQDDITEHHIVRGNDCDDGEDWIYPGAEELCFYDDEVDNDCDDGTNIGVDDTSGDILLYKHWDNDDDTGVNEGCEDDNVFDCEYGTTKKGEWRDTSANYWVGLYESAGACCGNNTYSTTSSGIGHRKETEFFPFWNTYMDDNPLQYMYSGCWDSFPIANNDVASTNLLIYYLYSSIDIDSRLGLGQDYPELERISSKGIDWVSSSGGVNAFDYDFGPVGSLDITPFYPMEIPVNVTLSTYSYLNTYIFHVNMSVWADEGEYSFARLEYAELEDGENLEDAEWVQTELIVMNGEGWRIKEYAYTPPNSNIKQIGLRVKINGHAEAFVRDAKIYNEYYRKVVNVNGTFYGCDVSADSIIRDQINTYLLSQGNYNLITSTHYFEHSDTALPSDLLQSCPTTETHYCSHKGYWKENVDGIRENNLSRIPEPKNLMNDYGYYEDTFYMEKDCCPVGYCWNGISCDNGAPAFVGVHLRNLTIELAPDGSGVYEKRNYKCVTNASMNGVWQNASLKPDQYNLTTGYCGEYQCYYDPPDGSDPLCVNDGNYTFDDYCLDGMWSSRTNTIALQLLKLDELHGMHDYVLFCDSFENALNDYDYLDPLAGDVYEYLVGENKGDDEFPLYDCGIGEFGCTNNFCVIKYTDSGDDSEKIVFGTSLNIPVNASQDTPEYFLSFIRLLGPFAQDILPGEDHHTYCDGVIRQQNDYYLGCTHDFGGGDYIDENEEWDVWYNTGTNSIIYAPQKVKLIEHDLWDSFILFLKNPFTTIINYLVNIPREGLSREDYSFVKDIGKFRRLYIANDFETGGLRKINGFVEKVGYETAMVVDYQNIGVDICKKVDNYNKKHLTDWEYNTCIFGAWFCPITCEPVTDGTEWSFHVESNSDEGIELWPELTAKIRLDIPPTGLTGPTAGGGINIEVTT